MATTGKFVNIEPQELQFPFELQKQISCSLQLTNNGDNYVGFKIKTTNPKKYCVKPNTGILLPLSSCNVSVTMQAQTEVPVDMQCNDKFLVQCIITGHGTETKDLNSDMFNKESGNHVDECKLRVAYVGFPRLPLPVEERSPSNPAAGLEQLSSHSTHKFERPRLEPADEFSMGKSHVSKLIDEKYFILQQNKQIQQELEIVKQGTKRQGIPAKYALVVALIGIFLGYILKKT